MIYLSILAAIVLFLVLTVAIARSLHTEPELNISVLPDAGGPAGGVDEAGNALSFAILSRVFGDDDRRFIAGLGDKRVEQLLLFERKRIALRWLRRKSAEARSIMRGHAQRAREARDLSVSCEARLALQFVELLVLCEMLALIIFLFGPQGFERFATQTNAVLSDMKRFADIAGSDAETVSS